MASNNIARLGIVLGIDTASFTADINKAISENGKLKNSILRDSNAAAGAIADLIHATEDYGKVLTKVELIQRETTSGRYRNATDDLKQRLIAQAKAYDDVANSTRNATAAQFKMNEQQKLALTYQTTDFFTQIASGQSPFIALIQQGGQLKDQMGGVGNAFKAIRSVLTPTVVGFGSLAAAFGIVGFAAYSGRREFEKLQDTITLTGNYAQVTTEKFYSLSTELSGRTHASIGMTKDALNAVMASGKFTAQSISSVTQAVIQYAQISGVDAKTAADKLMQGLDGTASGAKSLNREMNFLTVQQYKQIEALEQAGKKQEAAKVAADALNTQLAAQRRDLGYLDKAWENVTNGLSKFWNLLKEIGKPETTEQVIAQLDRQIQAVQESVNKNTGDSPFEKEQSKQLKLLKEQREALLETERLKARSAASKDVGDSKAKIEDYAEAGGIAKVKQIVAATEKLKADIKYTQALATANEVEKIELEAAKQLSEKRAEFEAKSEAEKRAMGGLLAKQLAQEEIDIEVKKNEKIRQIRQKEKIDTAKALIEEEQRLKDMNNEYEKSVSTARDNAIEKTRLLELDKEDLQLKQQNIYASEKEQKMAEISLKYKRLQITANGDAVRLEQLRQQEEIEKFNVGIQESTKKSQAVFDSVYGNMASAIDSFVKNGKLSMKDFARSVIQDLIAIELKASALSLLRMFFSPSVGPSLDGGGALPSSFSQYLVKPKAAGGPVSGNSPYLVGEKGPELFMPAGSGTIIPNSQTSQMGGVTNITNNYINAIDTKSFEDRLLGSSSAVWAANKYGEKSLATSYGRT
jgi:phage-related minor tail protein